MSKRLLYIIANSKPESYSTCQRTGQLFLNTFLQEHPEYQVETLRLFDMALPEPNHRHFMARAEIVSGSNFDQLTPDDKQVVHRMLELCQLFKSADRYVIVAPMWTLSFPYKLKQFIDCVILHGQTISISEKGVVGLLHEKKRKALYIQSSADMFPFSAMTIPLLQSRINHGITYCYDVFRFLGIECISPILVQGTEVDSTGDETAILNCAKDIKRACHQFR